MKSYKTTVSLFATTIAFVALTAIPALGQETEVRVTMKDLPAPVQQTVREQSKGAVVRGLAKEVEGGQTFYEAELRVNGHNKDVLMDPAGKIVAIEEQIALNALPAVVRTEIVKRAGKGRVLMVESITKDGAIVAYEAHVRTAGKISEIKVSPEGTLVN